MTLLQPKTGVSPGVPVEQLPAPSVGPQLLWPSIRYGNGIERDDVTDFPDAHEIRDRREFHQSRQRVQSESFRRSRGGCSGARLVCLTFTSTSKVPTYWEAL